MKLVKLFFAAAIAAVTLTGCEALAEAVSNSLSFVFSGVTVYDGQTALLGLTYKSEVDWTIATDSKDLVKLEYNDQGKNCVAKFNLPANADKQYKVHLKTSDRNDKSVEAYEGEITVAPWKLMIYKKGSDGQLTEIGTTSSFAKNGAGTYVVKMVYLNDKNQWVPVGSVLYRLELITGGHRVAWTSGGATHLIQDQADTNCSVEFDITAAPSNNCSVTATLGRERDANGNKIDIYQDKNRVDRSVTFTK